MGGIEVLELRIHGIANSPPAEMLCTSNEKVERKDGDEQGSFWQVKPTSSGAKHLTPSGTSPSGVDVQTEAYWWGNQARSGGSALALIGRAIVHLGWLLVLPFGLCNLAYWARRDITGADEDEKWWQGGDGAAWVRIFALLQTLFYTVGLVTVFVYLVGLQCFRSPVPAEGEALQACAGLPGWMDFLATWSPTARSALLGLVPVAVMLFIYLIGLRARGNFHPERSFDDEPMLRAERKELTRRASAVKNRADGPPKPPLLSTGSFWQRTRSTQISERTHLAAVFALVLFLLAGDALMDATGLEPIGLASNLDSVPTRAPVPFWGTLLGAVLLLSALALVAATGRRGKVEADRFRRALATLLVLGAALSYAAWCVWAIVYERETGGSGDGTADRDLAGQIIVPTSIAAAGAVIAVASLAWGYGKALKAISWTLLVSAIVLVGIAEFWLKNAEGQEDARLWVSVAAMVAVATAVGVGYLPLLSERKRVAARTVGWHGNGAAVALLIAWFSSLVITSLLVLGAHAWLTTDLDSAVTDEYWREIDGSPPMLPIEAPAFYARFAGSLVLVLIVLVVTVAGGAIAALRRFAAFSLPGLMYPGNLRGRALAEQQERDAYLGGAEKLVDPESGVGKPAMPTRAERRQRLKDEPPGTTRTRGRRLELFERDEIPWDRYPTREIKPSGRLRPILDARRIAGLAHRGESLMRTLAILTAFALVPLAIPAIGDWLDTLLRPDAVAAAAEGPVAVGPWTVLTSASGWALGLLAVAAATWVVTNAVTSTERPLGLVWDIICFFPRAGHPFTPPCYSERAVPEVKKRVRRFLRDEQRAGRDPFVILSAHSMGATIATAAIFSLYDDEQQLQRDAERARAESPAADPQGVDSDRLPPLPRIALLTHGVQLRAYFSRFFPEVFGAEVLGIPGTRGPALFRLDPWSKQVVDEAKLDQGSMRLGRGKGTVQAGEKADPVTLVSLLDGELREGQQRVDPRWRSLWRRTDYLGFPVFNYWSHVKSDGENENPIDRGATERSPMAYLWTVARHTNYLATSQYREARDELALMLKKQSVALRRERLRTVWRRSAR